MELAKQTLLIGTRHYHPGWTGAVGQVGYPTLHPQNIDFILDRVSARGDVPHSGYPRKVGAPMIYS
jgi:hypothetical protein